MVIQVVFDVTVYLSWFESSEILRLSCRREKSQPQCKGLFEGCYLGLDNQHE